MEDFLQLVKQMREAQMNFFYTKKHKYADEANRLQKEVDAYLAYFGYEVQYLPF
jgi:hypothetical protein